MRQSNTQTVAYVRVSTVEQHPDRQLDAIGTVDRVFLDKISGTSRKERPALLEMIDYVRAGDTIKVHSIDRLARSLQDLTEIVNDITTKGAAIHFLKESLYFDPNTDDPRTKLMFNILGSFAEFERSIIHERQREGIALAKQAGKYAGRKPLTIPPEQLHNAHTWIEQGVPKAEIARRLGISRATLYRRLNSTIS